MFYALAVPAYDLMKAVQWLCLPEECQGWTVPTLLKQMVRLPAILIRHARQWAVCGSGASGLNWWRQWENRWWWAAAMPATG